MASEPKARVELRLSCKGLARMDVLSKSDPVVQVFLADKVIGQTECIKDSSDPEFVTTVNTDYYFERTQVLHFNVVDSDVKNSAVGDLIGTAQVALAEILGSAGGQKALHLVPAGRGLLIVQATEIPSCTKENVTFTFVGSKLDKKDFFGKSDPYFQLRTGPQKVKIFESEIIRNTLNPVWKPCTVSLWTLCRGDKTQPVSVDVFDYDDHSAPDLIGSATITVQDMLTPGFSFRLVNEKKLKKSGYKNSGEIIVDRCQIMRESSFLEYLAGGLELNFTVGIDFTGSNGAVHLPSSLHYQNPYKPNDYISVLQAVGSIISYYDTDKLFPSFGFGGKMKDGTVSHDFALNGQPTNPYCAGVAGIIQAYQMAIVNVQLWGPTNFAPIIRQAALFAQAADTAMASGGKQTYFVLLIITDGVITDVSDTQTAIVGASALPLSIIIVGVGSADFTQMTVLDGDNGALRSASTGRVAARDIVQFVPFNTMSGDEQLATEVLAEIPDQVVAYFKSRGIAPRILTAVPQ